MISNRPKADVSINLLHSEMVAAVKTYVYLNNFQERRQILMKKRKHLPKKLLKVFIINKKKFYFNKYISSLRRHVFFKTQTKKKKKSLDCVDFKQYKIENQTKFYHFFY